MNTTVNSKFGSLSEGLATRCRPRVDMSHLRGVTINAVLAATPPVVLAIAAHDPLGGAGLAADLTTFAAFGVHGTVAVTAVTAQHLRSVDRVEPMDSGLVADQIDAIADTFSIAGVKTGLLGSAAIVEVVADRIEAGVLPAPVVDPVLVDGAVTALSARRSSRLSRAPSSSGGGDHPEPRRGIVARRTPLASVVDVDTVAHQLAGLGASNVVVTGGSNRGARAVDVVVRADGTIDHLESPWIDTVPFAGPVHVRSRDGCGPCSRRGCGRRNPSGEGVRSGAAAGLPVVRSRRRRPGCPLDHRVSGPMLGDSTDVPQSTCCHSSP